MARDDGVDHLPIDRAVVVHCDVAETDGLFELNGQIGGDDTHAMELLEGFGHGGGARLVLTGSNVRTNVYRHLNGPGQVERNDVLQVEVIGQLARIKRLFGLNAHQATA